MNKETLKKLTSDAAASFWAVADSDRKGVELYIHRANTILAFWAPIAKYKKPFGISSLPGTVCKQLLAAERKCIQAFDAKYPT